MTSIAVDENAYSNSLPIPSVVIDFIHVLDSILSEYTMLSCLKPANPLG